MKSATTVTPPPYKPIYPTLPEQYTSYSKPLTQPQASRSNGGPVDKMYIASAQAAPIITRSKSAQPNKTCCNVHQLVIMDLTGVMRQEMMT